MLTWAYGITTVPERAGSLLPATIDSLNLAGFDRPALFVDGEIDGYANLDVICHPRVGQLRNWLNGLFWLYTTKPRADRFAIFEDDILVCRQVREYLERCQLPERTWWNLLTHDDNLTLADKVPGWHVSSQLARGAAALVFDRRGVECVLRSQEAADYLSRGGVTSETAVALALRSLNYRELVHYPSLIQHVGQDSTLGHSYGGVSSFLGEEFDLLSIPIAAAPPQRKSTQCNFKRDGDYMVCTNPGCHQQIKIIDPLLMPEKYRARCKSPELRNIHSTKSNGQRTIPGPKLAESRASPAHQSGLGDRLEQLLSSIGITVDRYMHVKQLFGLPPNCNCDRRREWLNKVSDWWREAQLSHGD